MRLIFWVSLLLVAVGFIARWYNVSTPYSEETPIPETNDDLTTDKETA
jgi:hypothetical protein